MARGYANVKFEWNGSASTVIKNLGFGKGLNRDAAQILYEYSIPYIPYKDGGLTNRVRISANDKQGMITHLVPYASKQYYGDGSDPNTGSPGYDQMWERTRTVHPLATSYWDRAAWTLGKRQITQEIDQARLKYRSFNYGKG